MLIDTHTHLSDQRFNEDREEALSRARANGVGILIEVGCEPARWNEALEFCKAHPSVYCVLGVHPHEAAKSSSRQLEELKELASSPAVVGIGETGLDYHFEHSPRDVQKDVFTQHLRLARELGKPAVIHCRSAYGDLLALLEEEYARTGIFTGVIHCFSGTLEEALRLIGLGFYIGIDGPVTYPGAKTLRAVAAAIPLEKMLLESDAPYLPPQAFRGKRNEPSYIPSTAREIAAVRSVDAAFVEKITTANAVKLFSLRLESEI